MQRKSGRREKNLQRGPGGKPAPVPDAPHAPAGPPEAEKISNLLTCHSRQIHHASSGFPPERRSSAAFFSTAPENPTAAPHPAAEYTAGFSPPGGKTGFMSSAGKRNHGENRDPAGCAFCAKLPKALKLQGFCDVENSVENVNNSL